MKRTSWFTPGILLAGIYVLIVEHITGHADQWWLWLTALVGAIILDVLLGWHKVDVPKVKTRREYTKD